MSLRERLGLYGSLRPWSPRELIPVMLGVLWIAVGSSYCLDPWTAKMAHTLTMPLAIMPQQGWGIFFVFCGVLAIISSRWPPHHDTWGFVVLGASSMFWTCAYLWGSIFNDFRSVSAVAIWAAATGLIFAVNLLAGVKGK